MKIRLIRLILSVFLIFSQARAMDVDGFSEDHFAFAGLDAKPLNIIIKEDKFSFEGKETEHDIIKPFALEMIKHQKDTNIMMERSRVFDQFVISRSFSGVEVCHPDFQKLSLVNFSNDGLIYQNGELLTTSDTIWALDPHGVLCIFPLNRPHLLEGIPHPNHSLFFQRDSIGLPVACAGHIEVLNGKIKMINNHTGHYQCSVLQLVLVLPYLRNKGVFADDLVVELPFSTMELTNDIHTLLSVANMIELGF